MSIIAKTVGLDDYHRTLVTILTYSNGQQGLRIRRATNVTSEGEREPAVDLSLTPAELKVLREVLA